MQETEFHGRVANIIEHLWPSWYEHRWNTETATELWHLVGAYPSEDVVKLLREFYRSNNSFNHAEFTKAVRKRFRPRFDLAAWTVVDEHWYRMLWAEKRAAFREMTDEQFDEFCFKKIIGKRPTQHERSEATKLLNKHVKEANERLRDRDSLVQFRELGEIDPGF